MVIPEQFDANQRGAIDYMAFHKPIHDNRLSEFRRLWFGRTCERYRGSRTKIIFFRLPRAPIPFPETWYARPAIRFATWPRNNRMS